ncbi:ankyrin repeat-containing protein BDA1-like [Cornus florida]|uniref:ankyrin repeat-containing protein BDA1-like n=1 Tax=Cornus florida TaxID=4283 RepID=UPI00289F4E14|nr:ankyrin repeat-containing protein BDA1-like [Cornus florida]
MDVQNLFEAAYTGNVELLHKLLQEKPLILVDVALTSPPESLLHVATKAGQLCFVCELIKHNPELARELSKDGFMPMDIASTVGNVEIVKELLRVDNKICRLKGKDQRTALHYAAIKGRVGVIDLLLSTCPNSVEDVTIRGETALHLAVKSHQIEAFSALLKWLQRLSMETVINWSDCNGNTVLHVAASTKQLEYFHVCDSTMVWKSNLNQLYSYDSHEANFALLFPIVELLLSNSDAIRGIVKVNATNSKGLTAMDLLDIVMESPNDVQLREVLRRGGALGAQDVSHIPSTPSLQQVSKSKQTQQESKSEPPTDWFAYFKFQLQRDSPGETRNALLVVAALIATVTFQAGVNPPTGLLESTTQSSSGNRTLIGPATTSGLAAASAIFGSHATAFLFLFANTLGLTASLSIIIYLTGGFPFQRELLVSIYSMMFTYGFSISSITEEKEVITYLLLGIAFILPFSIRWLPRWGNKAWKWWRQHSVNKTNGGPNNVP